MELEFEIVEALIARLEESDKSLSAAVPRDKIMQAQTSIFFNLGLRDPELMKAGLADFASAMGEFKARLVQLVSEFRGGALNPAQVQLQWKALTGEYYERMFLAGAKSMGNPYYAEQGLTRKDAAFIAGARRFENRFFNRFMMDMKNPDFTPKMDFLDRAAAYAESGKAQFYNGMVAGAGDEVEIHWVMDNAAEHCGQCPILASKVWTWDTIPTTPGAGDTDCLFNCACHLEIRPRQTSLLSRSLPQMPGAATATPSDLPGRYGTVLDANGAEMLGAILSDVELMYKEMYKARQMIMTTAGEEQKEWIRIRKLINQGIIDRVKDGGFRALPTVSVTNLEAVMNWAKVAAPGGVITDLSLLRTGQEVVYIKANYWTKGIVDLRGGHVVIKTPAGDRWTYDNQTDILMSMVPQTFSLTGESVEPPLELMTIREFLEGVKDLAAQMEGGPGSGNFGHAGRPGEVGGSGPGDGASVEMGTDATRDFHGLIIDAELKDSWIDRMNVIDGVDVVSTCAGHKGQGQGIGGTAFPGINFRMYSVKDEETAAEIRKFLSNETTNVETTTFAGPYGNWATRVNGEPRLDVFSQADIDKFPVTRISFHVKSTLSNTEKTGREKIDAWWEKTLSNLESIPKLLSKHESIEEGGPGSGNFGHAGRPGEVGGSGEGSGAENAANLNSAPETDSGTGASKKWARENAERYKTDEEFRQISDFAVHYCQGNYEHLRLASMFADMTKEEFDAQIRTLVGQTALNQEWLTKIQDGSATFKDLSNPGDQYKVFSDQNLERKASLLESARALNSAIDKSEIRETPIYRGFTANKRFDSGEKMLALKEGDTFSLKGATSFTTDRAIADKFAILRAGGGKGINKIDAPNIKSVVFKIEKAKAVNLSPYSHWKQKEVVTRGNYRVKSIDYSKSIREIILEQEHETKD